MSGEPLRDPQTIFTFRQVNSNRQIGGQLVIALEGSPVTLTVPALRSDAAVCEIDPQRYRFGQAVFLRTPGSTVMLPLKLLREPNEWQPRYTAWDALSGEFRALKRALTASRGVRLFLKETNWESQPPIVDRLTGASYDGIVDPTTALAKTSLLNTFFRLRTVTAPVAHRPWFDFVTHVVAIGKERVLAFADGEMEDVVRFISEHIGEFRNDYERTPAENHRGNVPPSMQGRIERMVSIKSSHKRGNFQLTVTRLRDSDEVLLDADIDESGDLFGHVKDLIKHKFTGGTHPHDIHELLMLEAGPGGADLGYQLV